MSWSRYSPASVEDEHSSKPSTRLSSRSTSAQALFDVARVWSVSAPMTDLNPYRRLPERLLAPQLPRHSVEVWPELPRRACALRVRLRYQNGGSLSLNFQNDSEFHL